jgi:hypothetical protein
MSITIIDRFWIKKIPNKIYRLVKLGITSYLISFKFNFLTITSPTLTPNFCPSSKS